jgi:hypothetical protein
MDFTPANPVIEYNLTFKTSPLAAETNINDKDPLFVDHRKRDFRLKNGSPAIGAGKGGVTIGALEYPNVFYVDPRHPAAVDEPGWGYPAVPLASLAKACAIARPGETIVLRGGIYREVLSPKNNGVTVRAMTGEKVTISGSDLIKGWKREVDGSWSAPLVAEPKKLLRDGRPWSKFSYDKVARRIMVKSGGDPRMHVFETVMRERGIDLTGKKDAKIEEITVVDTLKARQLDYHFDGTISREVLENYLDRSVTMAYFLVTGKVEGNREYLYREDDVRLIRNIGAKFIGRAIYRWNGEDRLNDTNFWTDAKELIDRVHAFDPDVIFQGCLFETISRRVNSVKIPSWVFKEFGLPVEDRTFSYEAMLNQDGKLVNHWGRSSVPDITRLETQLWFYYLAGSYINLGCEALHLGQVGLIGMADPDLKEWSRLLTRIRAYAKTHARRHLVLLDAHVPTWGMIVDGVSLLDFNSFPLRIKEVPEKPYEAVLEVNHLDAMFLKSKGCVSPRGWKCRSLPYLVEFDNYGRSRSPNLADTRSIFVWGWDEISWLSLQGEEYRNQWLEYAYDWIKETDSNGHLQMPVSRMITCPNETFGSYRANTRSPNCPIGYSQEETIRKIWSNARK